MGQRDEGAVAVVPRRGCDKRWAGLVVGGLLAGVVPAACSNERPGPPGLAMGGQRAELGGAGGTLHSDGGLGGQASGGLSLLMTGGNLGEAGSPMLDDPCDGVDCGAHASCQTVNQTAVCECESGYAGRAPHCQDIFECGQVPAPCGAHASCENLDGGYRCHCDAGFAASSDGQCQAVDECERGYDNCVEQASCQPRDQGGVNCQCQTGFGDGTFCDADDCDAQDCGDGTCHEVPGGHLCECPLGQSGSSCQDSCEQPPFGAGLRAAVLRMLGRPSDDSAPILASELAPFPAVLAQDPANEATLIEGGLDGLDCWPRLQQLTAPWHQIDDLSRISRLTHLAHLDLSCNPVDDAALDSLSQLVALSQLLLDNPQGCPLSTGLSDISPLARLYRLQHLSVDGNELSDLSPLSNLKGLRTLTATRNDIEDLSALSQLYQLTALSLSNNQITDLAALSQLPYLSTLSVAGNQIQDLSPVSDMNTLRALDVSDNDIESLEPLADSDAFGAAGARLTILGNPLDCEDQAEFIQTLEQRGMQVISDCSP